MVKFDLEFAIAEARIEVGDTSSFAELYRALEEKGGTLELRPEGDEGLSYRRLELLRINGDTAVFSAVKGKNENVVLKVAPASTDSNREHYASTTFNESSPFLKTRHSFSYKSWRVHELDRLLEPFRPVCVHDIVVAAETLLEALEELHLAGVVHGDIKPQNVMSSGDGVVIIDFGSARFDPAKHEAEWGGGPQPFCSTTGYYDPVSGADGSPLPVGEWTGENEYDRDVLALLRTLKQHCGCVESKRERTQLTRTLNHALSADPGEQRLQALSLGLRRLERKRGRGIAIAHAGPWCGFAGVVSLCMASMTTFQWNTPDCDWAPPVVRDADPVSLFDEYCVASQGGLSLAAGMAHFGRGYPLDILVASRATPGDFVTHSLDDVTSDMVGNAQHMQRLDTNLDGVPELIWRTPEPEPIMCNDSAVGVLLLDAAGGVLNSIACYPELFEAYGPKACSLEGTRIPTEFALEGVSVTDWLVYYDWRESVSDYGRPAPLLDLSREGEILSAVCDSNACLASVLVGANMAWIRVEPVSDEGSPALHELNSLVDSCRHRPDGKNCSVIRQSQIVYMASAEFDLWLEASARHLFFAPSQGELGVVDPDGVVQILAEDDCLLDGDLVGPCGIEEDIVELTLGGDIRVEGPVLSVSQERGWWKCWAVAEADDWEEACVRYGREMKFDLGGVAVNHLQHPFSRSLGGCVVADVDGDKRFDDPLLDTPLNLTVLFPIDGLTCPLEYLDTSRDPNARLLGGAVTRVSDLCRSDSFFCKEFSVSKPAVGWAESGVMLEDRSDESSYYIVSTTRDQYEGCTIDGEILDFSFDVIESSFSSTRDDEAARYRSEPVSCWANVEEFATLLASSPAFANAILGETPAWFSGLEEHRRMHRRPVLQSPIRALNYCH